MLLLYIVLQLILVAFLSLQAPEHILQITGSLRLGPCQLHFLLASTLVEHPLLRRLRAQVIILHLSLRHKLLLLIHLLFLL